MSAKPSLGNLLRSHRESKKISVEALLSLIGEGAPTRQHIYNIEKTSKVSLDVLAALVKALYTSSDSAGHYHVDQRGLFKVAAAAFGVDLDAAPELAPRSLRDEEDFQKTLKKDDTVWILSDTLAETKSSSTLRNTIDGIKNDGIRYYYFVPPGHAAWKGVLSEFRKQIDAALLASRVRFIELTPFAFPCRLRIARPGQNDQSAVYTLQVPETGEYAFYPAPNVVVHQWVKHINLMLELADRLEADAPGETSAMKESLSTSLGELRILFPTNV